MNRGTLFALAAWALWLAPVSGRAFGLSTNQYVLAQGETLTAPLVLMATDIRIQGEAGDDLFLTGTVIELSGACRTDVWAAGATITVTGSIQEHARFYSRQSIEVDGTIGRGLWAVADTVRLSEKSAVQGPVHLVADNAILLGTVRGPLHIRARQVTLAGAIEGTVTVTADDLLVQPDCVLGGDLVYTTPRDLVLDPAVKIGGVVRKGEPVAAAAPSPWTRLALFLSALCVGLPFMLIFPRFSGAAVRKLRAAPWRCVLAGALATAGLPLAVFLCFLSLLGIPLALVLGGAFALFGYLSQFIVALLLGSLLLRTRGTQSFRRAFSALSIGLLAVYLAFMVPGYATTVMMMVLMPGLGALILALIERERAPRGEPASCPTDNPKDAENPTRTVHNEKGV